MEKIIKDLKIDFEKLTASDLERISSELEQKGLISFSLVDIAQSTVYYLQCQYYSKALEKTIIWDYDYRTQYDDEKDLIYTLKETERAVTGREKVLSINMIETKSIEVLENLKKEVIKNIKAQNSGNYFKDVAEASATISVFLELLGFKEIAKEYENIIKRPL